MFHTDMHPYDNVKKIHLNQQFQDVYNFGTICTKDYHPQKHSHMLNILL